MLSLDIQQVQSVTKIVKHLNTLNKDFVVTDLVIKYLEPNGTEAEATVKLFSDNELVIEEAET